MSYRAIAIAIGALIALSACSETEAPAITNQLPEMAIGAPSAPVTIIEYASMTCDHCAQFHATTLPKLKKDYINTGKVRLVFREFPLDSWALASAMLNRCVGKSDPVKFFAFLKISFEHQQEWVMSEDRIGALQKIARYGGLSKQSFEACLKDETILNGIHANRRQGEKDGVNATPSFLINGKLVEGNQPYQVLRRAIDEAAR